VAGRIPPYIESLAVTHSGGIAIGALWRRRGDYRVIALEANPVRAEALRGRFDYVISHASAFDDQVDAILLSPETGAEWDRIESTLTAMAAILSPHGHLFLIVPPGEDAGSVVHGDHLHLFDQWTIGADPAQPTVLILHRNHYDRIAHAQALAEAAHPDWAVELLGVAELNDSDEEMHRLRTMHRYLLDWDTRDDVHDRLTRFFLSQSLFANITSEQPSCPEAFRIHAEFWHRVGDINMAQRLTRTLQFALGEAIGESPSSPNVEFAESIAPVYDSRYQPKLLVILEPQPDYGGDVLFDGLAEVIGDENVVDFPWKDTLHGGTPNTQQNYPCSFERQGHPQTYEEIRDQLASRHFDAVLYCAHSNSLHAGDLRELIAAAKGVPIYIVDQSDSPSDRRTHMADHIGAPHDVPYFKREMLQCADYGPNAYPLPFAYPASRLPSITHEKTQPIFWAGHRKFGLRRLYLEHIETRLGQTFGLQLPQEAYADQIANARIGLSFFGFGYDTVRYWELPAHGCMLLSERVPICIPNNFVHGETAVFFDDLQELEQHLAYYLERPDEVAQIAKAGRAHLKQHHTGAARAKELLARMQQLHSATD
jgi:hypothetical protein